MMNPKSRTKNTIKNIYISVSAQIVKIIAEFILRTVFIKMLSMEYLGVNGLFANVLSLLSLAELGVGSAIIYSLYKPLAEEDEESVRTYMSIYKKVYRVIGLFIAIVGVCLVPFLPYIIAGDSSEISDLNIIYILFLLNSVSSYFFSYNQSLLTADQKIYIVKSRTEIFHVCRAITQCVLLILTRNYILYLIIAIVFTFVTNIYIYVITMQMYPYLKNKADIISLDIEQKEKLVTNIKALFLHKIGGFFVTGVDNIVISAFLGLTILGIYSNYTLITAMILTFLALIINSLKSSVGNYVVKESMEKSNELFWFTEFVWYGMYLFCSICLLNLLNPFIKDIWLGDSAYLLDYSAVVVIVASFYIRGLVQNNYMYKEVYGIFKQDRYKPLVIAVVNLVLSVALVNYLGISGVLIATIFTDLFLRLTVEPYVVFKYGFKKSPKAFYISLIYKLFTGFVIMLASVYVNTFIAASTVWAFILRGVLCCIVFAIGVTIFYFKSPQYKRVWKMGIRMIKKLSKRGEI